MKVLSQSELLHLSKAELHILLRRIAGELPHLAEGSAELRNAHINLRNIALRSPGRNSGRAKPPQTARNKTCAQISRIGSWSLSTQEMEIDRDQETWRREHRPPRRIRSRKDLEQPGRR